MSRNGLKPANTRRNYHDAGVTAFEWTKPDELAVKFDVVGFMNPSQTTQATIWFMSVNNRDEIEAHLASLGKRSMFMISGVYVVERGVYLIDDLTIRCGSIHES